MWQRTQPVKMIAGKLIAVPECGEAGDRIKTLDRINAGHYFIVIPANNGPAELAHARRDLIWTGVVSDDIAEIHDNVCGRRHGQARLKSFQIAVNVTQEKYAQ